MLLKNNTQGKNALRIILFSYTDLTLSMLQKDLLNMRRRAYISSLPAIIISDINTFEKPLNIPK